MKYNVRLTVEQMKMVLAMLPDSKEGNKIRAAIEKKLETI